MRYLCWRALAVVLFGSLSGCGLFDSGVEWKGGRYELLWIDTPENISIYRTLPDGHHVGRIDATVYAVGWSGQYLVAKQHPAGDKSKLNYFILDSGADSDYADPKMVVMGPLTEPQFRAKSTELKLPPFTKVLESLQ
jgi:hypothetical protein